ncbi:hypothetical protein BD410DRAFT_745851 [Rickenella mellea]|uniref:Uncharacterized protein n=1 Tax=Rickenella mellea TaxID=50990 RepID=A0A4Y7Q888_9AGAM|nr:hypothetical protein BD410DRAFT_745851 [Rickenella mellea]
MDENETTDDDPAVIYTAQFQDHLKHLDNHLDGVRSSYGRSQPKYLFPCGFWTTGEKDAFFHGLCVHSRLRPDLIASDIRTKSTEEVLAFIKLLDGATNQHVKRVRRKDFDIAFEVTSNWIRFEEEQAAKLIAKEPMWLVENVNSERGKHLKERLDDLKPLKDGTTSRASRQKKSERIEFVTNLRATEQKRWAKEDFLGSLSLKHLKVLDNVLRDAEEPAVAADTPTADSHVSSITAMTPLVAQSTGIHDDLIDPALRAISLSGSTRTSCTPPMVRDYPNNPDGTSAETISPLIHPPLDGSLPLPTPQADVQYAIQPLTNAPVTTASPLDADVDGEDQVDITQLSPRSRRRHQKRLYMRRKRAQLNGGVVVEQVSRLKPGRKTNKKRDRAMAKNIEAIADDQVPMEVDLDKAKYTISPDERKDAIAVEGRTINSADIISTGVFIPHGDIGAQTESRHPEQSKGHRNYGGTTLPYKIKAQLEDLGIDAGMLEENGMGMFHLSTFSKLMQLYNKLVNIPDDINSCISGLTIQLLHIHLVSFLADLMHRTIVLREQEESLKGHTKVWRFRDNQINAHNVRQALEMMGAFAKKEEHFSGLAERMSSYREDSSDISEDDEENGGNDGSESESDESTEQRDSQATSESEEEDSQVHHEPSSDEEGIPGSENESGSHFHAQTESLHAPFVWYPTVDLLNPDPFDDASGTHVDEDDPVIDQVDTAALVAELHDDDQIDAHDREQERAYEAALWKEYGRLVPAGEVTDVQAHHLASLPPTEASSEQPPRKRRKGASGIAYKSLPYIADSD